MSNILTLDLASDDSVALLTASLNAAGLRVRQSFDLRSAIAFQSTQCDCLHHGTARCDCQYIVLQVYEETQTPVTLLIHGHDGHTWVYSAEDVISKGVNLLHWKVLRALLSVKAGQL